MEVNKLSAKQLLKKSFLEKLKQFSRQESKMDFFIKKRCISLMEYNLPNKK